MRYIAALLICVFVSNGFVHAQEDRWQQRVRYKMKIDFDVVTHQFKGEQEIKYYNNSPDTLKKIFYHLYFNAFQPGSEMDIRSRTIADPDRRVADRIAGLDANEIGYHHINELEQDGKMTRWHVEGTILEVELAKPLYPRKSTTLKMKFDSQVPVQIRRSGRDNAEGIDYSMAQWYPKLCEYDYQGWHANPYIGREFYGVWGDFEVEIKIDDRYTLAGSGIIENANKIDRGYSDKEETPKGKKISWKFKAENVHDFLWAADRDYVVDTHMTKAGTKCYFVYQPGDKTTENWKKLPAIMDEALSFMNKRYGKYPYPVYYFIQGGDGGMEYPMATLITGERSLSSLVGVSVHEWMHSWYQMVLGTNESLYGWMDEGFTSFATSEVMNHLIRQKMLPGVPQDNPNLGAIRGYARFAMSGREEALSTHADHFYTNTAYGTGSYTKGEVFMKQLEYVVGKSKLDRILLKYFHTWKFKHPNSNDFIRVAEKVSDLELDWYREYFVYTTRTIDYAIDTVRSSDSGQKTEITLRRRGLMPMPIDLIINYKDGSFTYVNIPLDIMRGAKENEYPKSQYILAKDWTWVDPTYTISLDVKREDISSVEIDPSGRLADVDLSNNKKSLE